MPLQRFLALIVMTGVSGFYGLDARADEPPRYEVYAVRYVTAPGCPVSSSCRGPIRSGRSTSPSVSGY